MGIQVFMPQGTYFLTAKIPGIEAEALVREARVAIIPGAAFYVDHPPPQGLFRLAFCKQPDEIELAIERLEAYLAVNK
jgi:N-succinyldiaminopimelate aminotransferase